MLKAIAPGTGGGGGTSVTSAAVLTANALVIGDDGVRGIKSTATGTGVLTALGINVGSAGAFVTFNGAGGTPSSLVGTNITGTAAGLTAGTVTTNANLTGVITSVGNATSIASQTGTGTKFVVDTSPTIVGLTNSGNGAASAPSEIFTGTLFTGGTGTTTFPQMFVQPTGTTAATTWSTSGTIIGANVVSGFAGNFLDFHAAGGASIFKVDSAGSLTTAGNITGVVLQAGSTAAIQWTSRAFLTSPAAGSFQIGATDVDTNAAIVAQTLRSQGALAGGTADQAGKNWTFIASPGKGTGAGGSFVFQTAPAGSTGTSLNAPVTALTINSAGLVALPVIASDAALTDTTVCQDTTNHGLRSGSGALGVCLGTSGRQFKTEFEPMTAGLNEVMKIKLWNYRYKPGHGDNGARIQYGPTAQDIESVLPDLAGHGANGETINYDWGALIPISLRAIQQLKAETDKLLTISIRALQEQQEQIDDLVKRLAA